MKNKRTTSRLTITLVLTALCVSSRAAAGGAQIFLGEAFGSMQTAVQAGRAQLDKTRAAMDADDVVVTPAIGRWVMDKEDRIGQVVEIYPNDAGRYRGGGGVYLSYRVGGDVYISNDLSLELEYGDGVWSGDMVIDPDNEIGTVTRIFEGARNRWGGRDRAYRIQYKVGNGLYVAKGGLKREVQEYIKPHFGQRVSRGSTIITPENKTFTVDQVFSDGRVTVRIGAKTEVLTRDRYTAVPR